MADRTDEEKQPDAGTLRAWLEARAR
jgi:hypothetical protein